MTLSFGERLTIAKEYTKECAEEAKKRFDELIENAFKYGEFEVEYEIDKIREELPKAIVTAAIMTLAQEYTEAMDKKMRNNTEIIFETM